MMIAADDPPPNGAGQDPTESWPEPVEKRMKKTTYVLGIASGVALALSWRFLLKEGVKAGVKVGREVKKVTAKTLEDIQDVKAEALQEVADQDKAAQTS
jgi:hypothetical protein